MTNRLQIRYLPDANVLMAAYHHYYSPTLCPGFWDCLAHYLANGRLAIIDRVYDEILSPSALVAWVEQATNDWFPTTATQPVANAYRQIIDWVQDNPQFNDVARADFARGADGWLAAYAMVHDAVVVTNEVSAPDARRKVPLPDLCKRFDIRCINTFEMLQELGTRFDWHPP